MGRSLSWVAVRGVHAGELWSQLDLRPTGRTADAPDPAYSAASADGEWAVVCANGDDRFVDGAVLAPLSRLGDVVGCFVEEQVMLSEAVCWRAGACAWSVTHHAGRSLDDLQVSGELPPPFRGLVGAALAAGRRDPRGPDLVFDVPLDLAKAVVGFRHDEDDDRVFHELDPVRAHPGPPPAPPAAAGAPALSLLRRWLRRR